MIFGNIVVTSYLLISLWLCVSGNAMAEDYGYTYQLNSGGEREVCNVYVDNLNRGRSNICGWIVKEEYENILILPEWSLLDVDSNQELTKKIHISKSFGTQDASLVPPKIREDLLLYIENKIKNPYYAGHRNLFGNLDIDNDGIVDEVILQQYGSCYSSNLFGSFVMVVDLSKQEVDEELTKSLRIKKSNSNNILGDFKYSYRNIFMHEGRIYFDYWDVEQFKGSGHGYVDVYDLVDGNLNKSCEIQAVLIDGKGVNDVNK